MVGANHGLSLRATEDEARALFFEGGVNRGVLLTAKIYNQYHVTSTDRSWSVRERDCLMDGSSTIVGYRAKFKFCPRVQPNADTTARFCCGGKWKKKPGLIGLKQYPTGAEADARKHRDVITYVESRTRLPTRKTPTEQQAEAAS